MVETATCPTCRRPLGPKATGCFYCGPAKGPEPAAVPAVAERPAPAPAPALRQEQEPNTRCPICKNAIPAQISANFVCPACQSRLECLYAGPVKTVTRPTLSMVCTFHPEVQAVGRCRRCRKAVCETCAFRVRPGLYCPDCAAAPDEERKKSSTFKGILSLIASVVGMLLLGAAFVGAALSADDPKAARVLAVVLVNASLLAALFAIGFGFTSRDPTRGRSVMGLIGLLIGFLNLAIYVLMAIVGVVSGES